MLKIHQSESPTIIWGVQNPTPSNSTPIGQDGRAATENAFNEEEENVKRKIFVAMP